MNKKAAIHTFGCKLNQTEAMSIRTILEKSGFNIVSQNDKADLFIINTCTVTAKSDAHARQFIRKTIKNNPMAYIIVTGCYPQTNAEAIKEIKGVDVIIGNNEKSEISQFISNLEKRKEPLIVIKDINEQKDFLQSDFSHFGDYTRAFVKIQEGCDSECSYCIVRYARGPNRSAYPEDIIDNIEQLIGKGYKEIVLTGVHLGTYGNDFNNEWDLNKLLLEICKIDNLKQLRLSSIEPTEFTVELIQTITKNPKIAKHFHIPLQSGSDKILKLMNRPYNSLFYIDLIQKIKSISPDAAIGVDTLIGFPGETDSDFVETLDLIKKTPISYLHVFSYSIRPGTIAAEMNSHVQPEIKKQRSKITRNLGKNKWKEFCSKFFGSELEFLILSSRDDESGLLRGISHNYLRILVEGEDSLMNKFVKIKIDSLKNGTLFGSFTKEDF